MKNKIKNFIHQNNRILLFSILFIFFIVLSFKIFDSFLAEGEEHNILESEFEIPDSNTLNGISLACGDINGDKKDEIIVMKHSNKSEVVYFDEKGEVIDSFVTNIKDDNNISAGDVDFDGRDEIALVPENNNSLVKIFKNKKLFYEFKAFKNAKIGASLAMGDVNGDNRDEVVVGAGKNGGPQVIVYDFRGQEIASFFAFNPLNRKGINVAVGNVDEDGNEEVLVSQKSGGQNVVRAYKIDKTNSLFDTLSIYPGNINSGVRVLSGDIEGDERDEILVSRDTEEGNPELKIINSQEEFLKLSSDTLLGLEDRVSMDICDFKDSKAVVVNSSENYQEIKVIYKY